MEIKKTELRVKGREVNIEKPKLDLPSMSHEFIEKNKIKGPELTFTELPDIPLLKLNHLELFDNLEEEYAKVKDFDFKKLDIKDMIRK